MLATTSLLRLLQLASPVLPVGAYSYSEGLETLISQGIIHNRDTLEDWLVRSLELGTVRLEAALMLRACQAITAGNLEQLQYWNHGFPSTVSAVNQGEGTNGNILGIREGFKVADAKGSDSIDGGLRRQRGGKSDGFLRAEISLKVGAEGLGG